VATAVLGATLGAHAAGSGGLQLLWSAPVLWAWVIGAAAIFGTRTKPWVPRSLPRTFVLLLAFQAVTHVAMTVMPWAFGLRVHHEGALVTAPMIVAHLAAALVLTLVMARAERLLAAALAVVRAVRELLRPATTHGRHTFRLQDPTPDVPPAAAPRLAACRGPPLLAPT
jgi:hypothetical protein